MHFWLRSPPKSSLILTCYSSLYLYIITYHHWFWCVLPKHVWKTIYLLCDMLLLPSPWLRVSFRCNHYVIYHNLCHNCGRNAPCFGCYSINRLATLINPWLYWGVSLLFYLLLLISYHPIKYLVLTYSTQLHYQLGLLQLLLTILHFHPFNFL